MILGKLQVIIDADSRGLNRSLQGVDTRLAKTRLAVNKVGSAFAKFSTLAVAAVGAVGVAVVRSQLSQIDALAKTSAKLNIAIEDLQALRFAAEQTGVAAGTLDMALQRMTRRVAEAAGGTGEAVKALQELGLSADYLNRLSPDEAFAEIAEAMDGVASQGDRVRLAMRLFDTEGVSLVNTMVGGKDAINAFKKEAQDLGLTLTNVDAAKVESANDALNRVTTTIKGGLQTATVELAPYIEAIANSFTDAAREAGGFGESTVNTMQSVSIAIAKVADVVHIFKLGFKTLELAGFALGQALMTNFKNVSEVMQSLLNAPIAQANAVINQFNKFGFFGDIEPIKQVTLDSVDFFTEAVAVASQKTGEVKQELLDLSAQGFPSDRVTKLFDDIRDKAQEAAEATAGVGGGQVDGVSVTAQKEDPDFEAFNAAIDSQIEIEKAAQAEALERQKMFNQSFIDNFIERNQTELEAIESKRAQELEILKSFDEQELARLGGLEEAKTTIEKNASDARLALAEAERQAKISALSSTFGNLSSLMNTGSKKLFKIGKAAAKAGAIVDGYAAVQGAIKAGNKVGGPIVGAAFGAAAAIQTAVQVRNINQQQFGGSGGGASTFSGGLPAIRTTDAQGGGQGSSVQRNVSINLQGSNFSAEQVRGLIGQINEQIGDGVSVAMGA